MKKILCLLVIIGSLVGATGCSKGNTSSEATNKLVVWSFTDELEKNINNYYKPTHPEMIIEYSMTPTDQFPNKLDPVLASGSGAPDVFALEDAFVRKYVESGLLLDLTDIYEPIKNDMIEYPVEVGSYNGKVYALSWQATPGAMFYRRSLAKKYLGTDDPAEVQKYFSDIDTFMETAALLKEKSNGNCVVISAIQDLLKPFISSRKSPWVVDGKLVIDDTAMEFLEIAKVLHDKGYEGRVLQWSEGWFSGMQGTLKNEKGNTVEVFSTFLPTWGLHYVLKTNAPDTAGDWAMIPGPLPYRWGGSWIGAWKNTKNPEAAKELIRYLTTDAEYLEQYAKDSGDFVSNMAVVNKIKNDFAEPFLNGQNHYAEFAKMAPQIDGSTTQGTDQAIEALWMDTVIVYSNGEKTKDEAIRTFREQVTAQLGIE